ncbi:hypothetical protein ACTHGU_03295 [Chitinophagaceae bacterium MMS25-I14]
MKRTLLLSTLVAGILLASCSDNSSDDDKKRDVEKDGSVETVLDVQHLDSLRDVLTTTHKVWIKDSTYRTIVYHDTLPALGEAIEEAENRDGDAKNVVVKKDYQFFITVK